MQPRLPGGVVVPVLLCLGAAGRPRQAPENGLQLPAQPGKDVKMLPRRHHRLSTVTFEIAGVLAYARWNRYKSYFRSNSQGHLRAETT